MHLTLETTEVGTMIPTIQTGGPRGPESRISLVQGHSGQSSPVCSPLALLMLGWIILCGVGGGSVLGTVGAEQHPWPPPTACQKNIPYVMTVKNVPSPCQMSHRDRVTLTEHLGEGSNLYRVFLAWGH